MKSKVIKYSLGIPIVIILILVVGLLLSSCCSPSKRMIYLNYYNADELLGVRSEVLVKQFNETTEIEIDVPIGFEIGDIPIVLNNGNTLDYEIVLSDPYVDEGYEYTIERTIKFTLPCPAINYSVNVDLGTVVKKRIDINMSKRLYNVVHNSKNGAADDDINMYLVTINPNAIGGFMMKLTDDDIIRTERFKLNDKLENTYSGYFEYNECVILVYVKKDREIPAIYSEVNHFTQSNRILNKNGIDYVKFDVAQRGNTYYTYVLSSETRLFYLGYVQESFVIDYDIPNFQASVDIGFEMEKNTFYLLSNLERLNSDFMSIDMYASVNKSYVSSNNNMDMVNGAVLEKIDECAIAKGKYSAYAMYVGEDMQTDPLLNYDATEYLNEDIYVRVKSISSSLDNFEFYLNECEKPQNYRARTKLLSDVLISSKSEYFFKIDRELINEFLISRITHSGGYVYSYKSGTAIFYVKLKSSNCFSDKFMSYLGDEQNSDTWYPITSIRTEFNIEAGSFEERALINDYDYSFEFYIDETGDGSDKDYGMVDHHMDNYSNVSYTFFDTRKLYNDYDGQIIPANNYLPHTYKNTLYLNIHAPAYSGPMYPVITAIGFNDYYISIDDTLQRTYPVDFEYAKTHNGVFGIPIRMGNRYVGEQYLISITIGLAHANSQSLKLDFNNADFPQDRGSDCCYMTNDINFKSDSDFTFINFANKQDVNNIRFGYNTDIYLFSSPSYLSDIHGVYIKNVESEGDIIKTRISVAKVLKDILGKEVQIYINGINYYVMVMYQENMLFEIFAGNYTYEKILTT